MEIIRISSLEDALAARRIWKNVFIDNEEYLDFFFEKCFPHISTYALKNGEKILSIASLIDLKYRNLRLKYLYGVATPIEFRGKGHSSRLLEFLIQTEKNNRTDAILTRPANKNLFDYYRRIGFSAPLCRKIFCLPVNAEKHEISDSGIQFISGKTEQSCTVPKRLCLDSAVKGEGITLVDPVLQFAIEDFLQDSGVIFFDDRNYVFLKEDKGTLQIPITNLRDKASIFKLIPSDFKSEICRIILPVGQKNGVREIYGLACVTSESISSEEIASLPPIQFLME